MKKLNITEAVETYKQYLAAKELFATSRNEKNEKRIAEYADRFRKVSRELKDAIEKAEGKAKVRCITEQDICELLIKTEDRVKNKKALNGTTVYYDNGQQFTSIYLSAYKPISTHFSAEFRNGKWYVTDIQRKVCPKRKTYSGLISFSEAAKEAVIEQQSKL